MAARYWVGGSGTWNTTSTTNWSTASGGSSGASVPTAADSVFFDQAGTYTVTCTGALTCLDITVSAGTVTFATGTSPTFAISGSMSLLAGTVWSATGAITFNATTTGKTVTTNGATITGAVTFNGAGGGWTLGSSLTLGSVATLAILAGTFDTSSTGNYSVSCGIFQSNGALTRTINLNASTITTGVGVGSGTVVNMSNTGITFNAGTSTITYSQNGGSITFAGAGLTYYNLSITNAVTVSTPSLITGSNTFNNFSVTARSNAGVNTVSFDAKQIINGTLSTNGTAGNRRISFGSNYYGISVDLAVNSAPSLTDADFRGIYVTGTAAPISGTRIGNRGECKGITFSTPKTVYWNLAGSQLWAANGWAATSTGSPSTDYFPLPQDTATFTNAGSVTGTITLESTIGYASNVDMSGRTSAMTLAVSGATTAYGNWTNGSGTTISGTSTLTFSGGGTQTITSAGKTFTCPITIDTYGGTVQLADALNIGANALTVTNGTFDTKNFNITANQLTSNNSNVRAISLGSSTVALTISNAFSINIATTTNLTFNAGTSQINLTATAASGISTAGLTFYNVASTQPSATVKTTTITGTNTFNNLSFSSPTTTAIHTVTFSANQTINGTLTCAGASAVQRVFLLSDTIGTQRTLTVNSISATDCDFRDINLAGTATGASPTRAGNCGNNTGITFPSPKTVYYNSIGPGNWSSNVWSTSIPGTSDITNFPLAQDTAVIQDVFPSASSTVTINAAWNIGTFDASNRTSAMTLSTSTSSPVVYGDWKFGTGVTSSSTTGTITFSKNGTQTITSNGVQFGCPITINRPLAYVQLADALSLNSSSTLTIIAGTFDAVTYNVTTGLFSNNGAGASAVLKMGSGTWTVSGTGNVWLINNAMPIIAGTSTIVLSNTSTSARTFLGGGYYYNKLTIGGTTGTSSLTIIGNNTFGELASTKTVAHTIIFTSSTTTSIGKWSVTGTAGNVVTLSPSTAASAYTIYIYGPATSGIDYLSVSYCTVSTVSPGEFYVGANSTNTAGNTRVIFTATPSPRTLYWVGGTGNWSSTTKWSTSSGGGSGAAIPTSLDAVNFDSLSNATAYTATIDAGVTIARCASFTMAGPASGNVTFAGTTGIVFHGNVSFAATGITCTYTGGIYFAGNSSYTITTNGLALASTTEVLGIGSTWTLGSALNIGSNTFFVSTSVFSTSASNYAVTASAISSNASTVRTINLNGSTVALGGTTPVSFTTSTNLTFNAGTSQINCSVISNIFFNGGGNTFYNVACTAPSISGTIAISNANTFNTLSFVGRNTAGVLPVTFSANQTIGTLTLNAGTNATMRTFLASDTIGTQRTLAVTTLTAGAADYDFRDIAVIGTAAPLTGTRFGDCKGNSGITFPSGVTRYWNLVTGGSWSGTGWAASSGGSPAVNNFPLAQDTAIFEATGLNSGQTITVNQNYNIGTIDMSARTSNTMTLATGTQTPTIYGNWINGTGTTLTGTSTITFAGRGSQTITSAGKTFTQPFAINTPGGSVTLQDAYANSTSGVYGFGVFAGTIDAGTYNVTMSGTPSIAVQITTAGTRTVSIGSGTWSLSGLSPWQVSSVGGLTITGTGTISMTSASAKTFIGGSISYSGITLNQGGAGALTIFGNNTFKDITNTYSATGAATINLNTATTTLTQFTGTGAATRLLTLSGTSAASPATLILSSGTVTTPDYLSISNVRAYSLSSTWYAGANSTNLGSLGWIFAASGGVVYNVTITETSTGTDAVSTRVAFNSTASDTATGTDSITAGILYLSTLSETATGTDSVSASFLFSGVVLESASATETVTASATFRSTAADTATGTDAVSAPGSTYNPSIAETGTASDLFLAVKAVFATVAETATGADAIFGQMVFASTITDSATGADSITARASLTGQITETASGADLIFGRLGAVGTILESATGTDAFSAASQFGSAVLELATGSDIISAKAQFAPLIFEVATITEAVTAPGSTYNPTIVETATGTATDVGYVGFATAVLESATGSDAFAASAAFSGVVLNTATATDTVSSLASFGASLAESATGTDLFLVAPSTFNAPVFELATVTDALTAPGSIYNPSLVETITISDYFIGGYLWNPIDDSQTPDWGNINNTQSAGWTQVNDTQAPSWQNVDNSQAPGWTQIDDTQAPGWQDIKT